MKRELVVGVAMVIGFCAAQYLLDAPVWASAMSAWLAGMWADLRMGR